MIKCINLLRPYRLIISFLTGVVFSGFSTDAFGQTTSTGQMDLQKAGLVIDSLDKQFARH